MIETETKTRAKLVITEKTPSYPGVQNFARPSVRPFNVRPYVFNARPIVFNIRPMFFSMYVRPIPSYLLKTFENQPNQKMILSKHRKTAIHYFRIFIATTPFLTRLARVDRAQCHLSICATLIENGDV